MSFTAPVAVDATAKSKLEVVYAVPSTLVWYHLWGRLHCTISSSVLILLQGEQEHASWCSAARTRLARITA